MLLIKTPLIIIFFLNPSIKTKYSIYFNIFINIILNTQKFHIRPIILKANPF